MLQIIGWLGCGYLLVKACELFGGAHEAQTNSGRFWQRTGAWLSLALGLLFFAMLGEQSSNMSSELGASMFETDGRSAING